MFERMENNNIWVGPEAQRKIDAIIEGGAENLHVLADFDRTLTLPSNYTSWAVLAASGLFPQEYVDRRQELFDQYHPFEIDPDVDHVLRNEKLVEWWQKHLDLIIEFKITKDQIAEVAAKPEFFKLRPGVKEALAELNDKGIPVIIVSAAVGNFIQSLLDREGLDYSNIHIISNILQFDEEGIVTGIETYETPIHVGNKDEKDLPPIVKELINGRENVIVLGDTIDDIKMANLPQTDTVLTIGFLERNIEANRPSFRNAFDLVLEDEQPFDGVNEIINKLRTK